uniref:Uncharacterized protein n=1 Tax=Anguilla anguilla TaxID=7936 RepID=A0A0E9Q6C2_ANGAN
MGWTVQSLLHLLLSGPSSYWVCSLGAHFEGWFVPLQHLT